MATVKQFEDLAVWKAARELSKEIHVLSNQRQFATDKALRWQILRAAGSVMDNIAEGFERGGRKEFIQFLSIAKGSAGEVRSQLYRAFDYGFLSADQFNDLLNTTRRNSAMINNLMQYLKNTEHQGAKYNNQQTGKENL